MTQVKPRTELAIGIEANFPASLEAVGSFEAIKWQSGHVLIIARGERCIASDWIAILAPGANTREMMPQADLDLLAEHEAADVEAWDCIYTGDDGRHYLDRAECKIRIEERR